MNNKIDPKSVIRYAINQFAVQFDLPELRSAVVDYAKNRDGSVNTEIIEAATDFAPRGQMAGIVAEAHVRVSMGVSSDNGFYYIDLGYKYNHTDGGSNGYNTVFVAVTERSWGDWNVVGLVTRKAFGAIERKVADAVHAAVKAKAEKSEVAK